MGLCKWVSWESAAVCYRCMRALLSLWPLSSSLSPEFLRPFRVNKRARPGYLLFLAWSGLDSQDEASGSRHILFRTPCTPSLKEVDQPYDLILSPCLSPANDRPLWPTDCSGPDLPSPCQAVADLTPQRAAAVAQPRRRCHPNVIWEHAC